MKVLIRKLTLLLLVVGVLFALALPAVAQEDGGSESSFDLPWLQAVIAFFLPLVISFFKKSDWPTNTKRALALVVSAIVGVVAVGAEAGWTFTPISDFLALAIGSITQIWVVAQVAYLSFWEGTSANTAMENTGLS